MNTRHKSLHHMMHTHSSDDLTIAILTHYQQIVTMYKYLTV